MGSGISSLYELKAMIERKLSDQKRHLTRVLSKSNSMEALDKVEIRELKLNIEKTASVLNIVNERLEESLEF